MKPIRFRDEATTEFRDAIDWYEDQEDGLGDDFIDEVDATVEKIRRLPRRFPTKFRDVRRALVSRFPFAVYFQEAEDEVLIVAVYHLHRDASDLADR